MSAAILVLLVLWLYFTPALVAFVRRHNQRVPILIINAGLGWTGLGWICALAWAASNNVEQTP